MELQQNNVVSITTTATATATAPTTEITRWCNGDGCGTITTTTALTRAKIICLVLNIIDMASIEKKRSEHEELKSKHNKMKRKRELDEWEEK